MQRLAKQIITIVGLGCSLGFVAYQHRPLFAQDLAEDERAIEFQERLEIAKAERTNLRNQSQLAANRIELLQKGIELRAKILTNELTLEKLGENDPDKAEVIQEQLEQSEWQMHLIELRLDANEHRKEVFYLVHEANVEGQEQFEKPLANLSQLSEKVFARIDMLEKAFTKGSEQEIERIERQLDELLQESELRFELLEVRRGLFWATEEGETEEAEELKQHQKHLEQRLKRLQNSKREAAGAAKLEKPGLPPIKLSPDEIVAAGKEAFEDRMSQLLRASCFECHDSQSASGDLDLESMSMVSPFVKNRSHWINAVEQLKNRSMPPADSDQPTEASRRFMVAWLTDRIENFDYASVRRVGYEPAKRLTHDEYNHTVRDLFGVDLRPAEKFPDDMVASSGFDNSGNSLFLQPTLLERYVGAADEIVRKVFSNERSRIRLIGESGRNADAKKLINAFASRAFRRPVTTSELNSFMAYYNSLVEADKDDESAMKDTIQAILVSPSFLIRSEQARGKPIYRVSDWELASRLSYFLWASMPDDELFELANRNVLHQPDVLRRQVDRMLKDPKSETLGRLFAAQWLGYINLNRVRPGPIDNPWCTDSLCEAMLQESSMFFHSIVQRNAPIDELITGDYTFLNEELSKHYGVANVQGQHMRRVSLSGTERGGILGHASILAVTSFPGRTSPVLRGNWILSELLGTPPPPPPPNASQFDEEIRENDRLTQRQKLERHRDNPNCYACHSQIDPLGFSLERFDWFGRYRPKQGRRRLSALGEFPNGTKFTGLFGLQEVIVNERIDDLVMQLTRKMLAYALGRQLEYFDEATVREVAAAVHKDDRRITTLIHKIVHSDTFQMQQPDAVTRDTRMEKLDVK